MPQQGRLSGDLEDSCTGIRTGDMMLVEAEQAVREALVAKFGDKADLGGASLISAVTDKLGSCD